MYIRQNPWRYNTPPGWNNIKDAPRDGTVIETQNNYGVAPTFGLHKWVDGRGWVDAADDCRGTGDGPHLSWRSYSGDVSRYDDPTHGAQNTRNYWLLASGFPAVPGGDLPFGEEPIVASPRMSSRDLLRRKPKRKSFWSRLFD